MPVEQEILAKLTKICESADSLTDFELAKNLKEVYRSTPANLLINHHKSNELVAKRVLDYCTKNNIKLKNYKGPLPFSFFVIDVDNEFSGEELINSSFLPDIVKEELHLPHKRKGFLKKYFTKIFRRDKQKKKR